MVITRSGYSCPVTSHTPSEFCAEVAQKIGKHQVHACNSTRIIIIINAVAVIAIITFIFCFSDLLIWLVLLRHVIRLGLLLLGRLIDWSAVPCDADGFFLTCEDFRGMFDDSVPACIKKKKINTLPPHSTLYKYREGVGGGYVFMLESLQLSVCQILPRRYLLNCSTIFNQTWYGGVP